MPETETREIRLRRLTMRSMRRGIREMDILLMRYVRARLDGLSDAELDVYDALLEAGSTRFRPIVMTTLAMIFGMMPMALNIHGGSGQNAPMAHAVIGGLISSSLLTLSGR